MARTIEQAQAKLDKKTIKQREAINRLEELKEQIYEALEEMEDIISEIAPEEYESARRYWIAHIDGALENRGGWLGGSFISFADTLEAIEEKEDEEEDEEDEEDEEE